MVKSVGLLVMTRLPDYREKVAILHRRGVLNENLRLQSWAGGFQVTATGKVEEGEKEKQCLYREIGEEIGKALYPQNGKLVELFRNEERVIYGIYQDKVWVKNSRLSLASGGLVPVTKEVLPRIKNLLDFSKETGVKDRDVIAMFPDEITALKRAFKKIVRSRL